MCYARIGTPEEEVQSTTTPTPTTENTEEEESAPSSEGIADSATSPTPTLRRWSWRRAMRKQGNNRWRPWRRPRRGSWDPGRSSSSRIATRTTSPSRRPSCSTICLMSLIVFYWDAVFIYFISVILIKCKRLLSWAFYKLPRVFFVGSFPKYRIRSNQP